MMLATDLAVLDHGDGTVLLIANVVRGVTARPTTTPSPGSTRWAADLPRPAPPSVATLDPTPAPEVRSGDVARRTTRPAVEAVREHIRAGDAFQVVLSQRFEAPTDVDALDVYRVLRATQPVAVHVPAALRRPRVARTTSWGPRPRRW